MKIFTLIMMDIKSKRLFNCDFRKKLLSKCQKLNEKSKYMELYNIIRNDIKNCSSNRSGIYINLNQLSDFCIYEIVKFINDETLLKTAKELKQSNNVKQISQKTNVIETTSENIGVGVSFSLKTKKQKILTKF